MAIFQTNIGSILARVLLSKTKMTDNKKLTHIDQDGNPSMVDVGNKQTTVRHAHARATVLLPQEVMQQVKDQDIYTKKGAMFQTAIIAGTMGAKKTSELIPLCHPLSLDSCKFEIQIQGSNEVVIDCFVRVEGKTGVEMEALTGASVAALTIYDMCKGLSQNIVIKDTKLMQKTGGKTDFKRS
ncbi:molybdenum cofactor biosynthesis protein C [Microscilla marina ATCC 23134]|uniref:cyclic pyranopterin monophosphate synthase n=2 Tax=Microscilla marina TaxID=1027 RepID=A1ZUU4_MICM2|nr:molybdenum cofactor biosynthesis protein C [Microscilla marina ATCC 23134]